MVQARMMVAVGAIALIVAVVYVFSIIPYLPMSGASTSGPLTRGLEILVPVGAAPLILVLLFLVPARRSVEVVNDDGSVTTVTRPASREQLAQIEFKKRSLLAGSLAGLAAALVLVGLISVGDFVLGFPTGAFYQIVALAMTGSTTPSMAIALGLALHLISGTAIGAVFGFLSATVGSFNIDSIRKGATLGVLAGFVSFSLLFIPITRYQVEPALAGIIINTGIIPQTLNSVEIQNRITDIMSTVLAFSILFHVVYGAIMGSLTAIFISRMRHQKAQIPSSEPESALGNESDFSEAN